MMKTYLKSSFWFHLLESQEKLVQNDRNRRGVSGRGVAFGPYRWTGAFLCLIAAISPLERP
jgi:hypothetical protein